jgi:rhamnosyltransferase
MTEERICAVVITYFPDSAFSERLKKIAEQVSGVIVVDNGTSGSSLENLDKALDTEKIIDCIRNSENLGVSAALNQGIKRAIAENGNCSFVATFDQDSIPADNMVNKLLAVWKSHPNKDKVMIAGPKTTFIDSTSQTSSPEEHPAWKETVHVITSGSLISRRAFELVGFFNEKLFIDYVDFEYCLRLRTLGYQVIEVYSTEILHHMGKLEERIFLGEKVHPTHHPPIRRYYQFRNALLLHSQYRKTQSRWCWKNRIILIKIIILVLLYEKQRLQSLFQIVRGICHGLAGRSGRNGELPYDSNPNYLSQ